MNLEDKLTALLQYAYIENTELGEVCAALCDVASYPDYISTEFFEAVEKEIDKQLENFKKNSRVVEEEEITTQTVSRLEWAA